MRRNTENEKKRPCNTRIPYAACPIGNTSIEKGKRRYGGRKTDKGQKTPEIFVQIIKNP